MSEASCPVGARQRALKQLDAVEVADVTLNGSSAGEETLADDGMG